MENKAYKFRLSPNQMELQLFHQFAGCARYVYNRALSESKNQYEENKTKTNYFDWARSLIQWKYAEETSWLKECPAQVLQQSLKNLESAFTNFFSHRARYPKFKKKGMKDSFRYPQFVKMDAEKHRVYLPKIGWVKYKGHRPIEGTIKQATVSYKAGHWYVSIMVEYEPIPKIHPFPNNHVGLDMGVVKTIATSNGVSYRLPKTIQEIESKIKTTQRKIARCVKGSNRRNKLKLQLQKLWCKLSNVRNNFIHQITTDICKNHAVVVVEDLYVTGMTKSARGTIELPGKNVAQKRGLNRNILKQSWGTIVGQLGYKLNWLGGAPLVIVSAAYTSQTCTVCGVRDKRSRVKQSVFRCTHCGHTDNADYNAAKIILSRGIPPARC